MWLKKRCLRNIWMVPKCLTYSWSNDWICYWQCCLSIRRYSTNFRAKHWRKFDLCYSIHSGLLYRKCVEFLFCQTTLFNLLENSRRLGKRKKNEIEQMASCGLMVRILQHFFSFELFEIIRTIHSNNEKSEQVLVTECFFNLFLEISQF